GYDHLHQTGSTAGQCPARRQGLASRGECEIPGTHQEGRIMTGAAGRQREHVLIVDADIHANDTPEALAPHCAMPWRKSLEALAGQSTGYLSIPGFAPNFRLDPPIPGSPAPRSVKTAAAMRAELSELGIEIGIIFPDHMLLFATLPNIEYATAVSHAYNRWLVDEWLKQEPGLYGVLLACPQNPVDSAREIEKYAAEE